MSARVLFVAAEGVGHLFPLIPLAWAARAAGHEVLVASTGGGLAAAEAGLSTVDYSPELPPAGLWGGAFAAVPRLFVATYPEQPDLAERMQRGEEPIDLRMGTALFAGFAEQVVARLVSVAESFRPDVLVHDALCGAGPVAAAAVGVPAVRHELAPGATSEAHSHLMRHLAASFAKFDAAAPAEQARIDMSPPSMVAEAGGWPMRCVPYNGGTAQPPPPPAARRRVAVTMGTIAPHTHGPALLARIVEAASEVDAEFVLALGDTDPALIGPTPENVRALGWTHLGELLGTADAVVHHGGASTTFTALAAGVPQLLLPNGADRHANAAPVRDRGAGLLVEPDKVDAGVLGALLDDGELARCASDVAAEIRDMPAPSTVVPRLVAAAGG